MKSQSALEFMTIVGIGLIILAVTSAFGIQSITSYSSDVNTINARQTVNNLISATKLVYSQGINSQTKVFVTVPNGVILNRTYLYDGEINYRFEDSGVRDYFQKTGIKTYGILPTSPGKITVTIRMLPESTFESILPGIETGAYYYIDEHDVSFMLIETYFYNGSDHVPEKNFSSNNNLTIAFIQMGFDKDTKTHEFVNENIELSIYRPDSFLFFREEYTDSGVVFEVDLSNGAGNPGMWIVSLMDIKTRSVATTMFHMAD